MSSTWQELMTRMPTVEDAESIARVEAFIRLNNLQSVHPRSVVNRADAILDIWQVRHKNTSITGVPIPGISTLLHNLRRLPPDARVDQYGFTGNYLAGSLFFYRTTGEFLGDTIVERRPKSKKMLELESHILGSSRKSA
jgi:hypothetical protein